MVTVNGSTGPLDDRRAYLQANNGIDGLDVVAPDDIESAVRVFRRDGFVVVRDVLDPAQLDALRAGALETVDEILAIDPDRAGNRGAYRYSFGGSSLTRSMLHRPEWQMLIDLPRLTPLVTAIFESDAYMVRSAGGDFCLPGAHDYQRLHSDMGDWKGNERTPFSAFHDPGGRFSIRDLPCPYVCANFLVDDQTALNGPTRQIPGTQNSRQPIPKPDQEPEWMRLSSVCPAPAGSVQLRDVRAWHGGTPNLSDATRMIPNVEFYAPWFREPIEPCIPFDDWLKLSPHAQSISRQVVADSSVTLETGFALNPLPTALQREAGS